MGTRYSEINRIIGASLQAQRKKAGFKSAKAFADHVGVNQSTYTDYEQGKASLSYERAWEFADALDCTLDALGGRKPPERVYDDPRQEAMNDSFEVMNDRGRDALTTVAKSLRKDAENRVIVKDSTEPVEVRNVMGA